MTVRACFTCVVTCRTRFVPPGARQGPNTIGWSADGSGGCDTGKTWSAATTEACQYNAYVKFSSSKKYAPHSCAAEWLQKTALSGANTTVGPTCYPGTSFLYTYINQCSAWSRDMRLSDRSPGGPGFDKCSNRLGRYAVADDLWSAMASYQHEPCGWPFVECVADCSLPSALKTGWQVDSGTVIDTNTVDNQVNRPVGCTTGQVADCDPNAQPFMKDPKTTNKIHAM